MKITPIFRTLTLVLVFLSSLSISHAQDTIPDPMDDGSPKKISGGYGYAAGGIGMKDMDPLINFMNNGASFSSIGPTLGGGGLVMIRSILLGGEGVSFFQQKLTFGTSLGTQDLTYDSGWGKFYMGYVVLGKKGILLYPKVGIGGYKHSISLTNDTAVADMDTIFAGTYTGTNLVKKGMLMSFSLGFEYMPGFDETAGSGLVFGVDIGYNLAVTEKEWESFGTPISNGPTLNSTGFYAAIHLGFGGWNRQ